MSSLARVVELVNEQQPEDDPDVTQNYSTSDRSMRSGPRRSPSEDTSRQDAIPIGSSPVPYVRRTSMVHDSPFSRTGPPRSFSYSYNRSTPQGSRSNSNDLPPDLEDVHQVNGNAIPTSMRSPSDFRGALEYSDPGQREREREAAERKERNRMSRSSDAWNPLKWIVAKVDESPSASSDNQERTSYFVPNWKGKGKESQDVEPNGEAQLLLGVRKEQEDHQLQEHHSNAVLGESEKIHQKAVEVQENTTKPSPGSARRKSSFSLPKRTRVSRAQSLPQLKHEEGSSGTAPRWNRLRSLLPSIAHQGKESHKLGQSAVQAHLVNITDELLVSGLSTVMLRLWFERDEGGIRRIPVLLHRLRIRISDSLHPLHENHAVFRIECEYANGAARWVVYRQLRDFLTLHAHYRLQNAYARNIPTLPEFPRTSLPYFRLLQRQGKEIKRADFAIIQRQALEDYLIGLIRAVLFHPSANRLAGFLEISALSIALSQSGGWQAKAGMLRIEAYSTKSGGFGRKGVRWREKKKQRWCAVRDSYLVALEEPGELKIWDVFLLDSDFQIERPMRYYRQGLNLFHLDDAPESIMQEGGIHPQRAESHHSRGTLRRLSHTFAKKLHIDGYHRHRDSHRRSNSTSMGSAGQSRSRTRSGSASSDSSSSPSQSSMHLVDPSTHVDPTRRQDHSEPPESKQDPAASKRRHSSDDTSRHTFFISNAQMKLKLVAKNERQMQQWITALEKTAAASHWTGRNRFDSFAPIRLNVAAQWLVDGRDYLWNLSRAMMLAKESIYIHDWWLSPELQMRRPNKDKYRLDRLLERKAKEGVKIYIIIYKEVSSRTTPVDSNYTKQTLSNLHPNIMVQRSPSHFQTGTFYWAHHEKLCVIDETIAFMGGIDLCFGRWDTPQHVLVDIPDNSAEDPTCIWPGKDYSNGRVSDFYTLNKPFEDMYDREKVPRMPWHDVGMHIVGQPARDLSRHFVERWNHLLRIKNHTRTFPFLLPPPDFRPSELTDLGLTGTCEIQICRSAGPWSLGTPQKVEHSIQNAYLKAIQLSEHFVYIENQFFITSTVVNDVVVENKIGDALVHRIIRAHHEGVPWRACIIIPLLPGFTSPLDSSDASAVRIILECQNRTICRGPNSIFSRLRKEGIDPNEYISVFSLRNWAKLPGDVLTTEQVYIHGKVCIVDDRLAIIGSANINDRSQRGDRDSELAAIIRDTDMIDGNMAGKPFKVGRFAHTLRVRLMREHLGVDVDSMYEEDLIPTTAETAQNDAEPWDPNQEQQFVDGSGVTRTGHVKRASNIREAAKETMGGIHQAIHGSGDAAEKDIGYYLRKVGIKSRNLDFTTNDEELDEERNTFTREGDKVPGFASSKVPTLEEKTILEHRPPPEQSHRDAPIMDKIDSNDSTVVDGGPPEARVHDGSHELYGAPADASEDPQTDNQPPHARTTAIDASQEEQDAVRARSIIRKHLSAKVGSKTWSMPTPTPEVDPHGFGDPISDKFWKNVWVTCAVHNTEIFRKVFHALPDDTITTWKQYKEFILHHERLNKPVKDMPTSPPVGSVPSEAGDPTIRDDQSGVTKAVESETEKAGSHLEKESSQTSTVDDDSKDQRASNSIPNEEKPSPPNAKQQTYATGTEPFEKWEREAMEELLQESRGHLVLYPTRFLEDEDVANNFLFNADRLLPMPIYD